MLVLTVYEDVPVFGTAQCILSADNMHCLGPEDEISAMHAYVLLFV